MARFRNFYNAKISQDLFKKPQCVSNRCKDLFKPKKYFGVIGTLSFDNEQLSLLVRLIPAGKKLDLIGKIW